METISHLKKHAAALDVSEPLAITQNGTPVYVVSSYEDWLRSREEASIVKLFAQKSGKSRNFAEGSSAEIIKNLSLSTLV